MGFFDSAMSWLGNNSDTISNVASLAQTGYGMYNQQQTASALNKQIAPGGIVDPFGAQRPMYQQKLANLYNDPSYIQNTPGYQFQMQMGEQAVNRNAAKSGHFHSPNRLYELSKFNQGLAATSYNNEANRLAQLAGSGINPNAGAYLQGQEGATNLNTQTASMGGDMLKGVLDLFGSGSSGGSSPNPTEGDPAQVSGPNPDPLSSQSLNTGNVWEGLDAATALGSGAVDRANSLSGLVGDADMGGADFANYFDSTQVFNNSGLGTAAGLDPSLARYQNTTDLSNLSTVGSLGFAGGGMLGSMAAKAITGSDDPASQYIGATAGTMAGGAAMGAAGIGGISGGAAGGAAAGAAVAGPLLPVALAAMAYGGYASSQAESKFRKEAVGGGLYSNVDWNNATGSRTHTYGQGSSLSPEQRGTYKWSAPNGEDYWLDKDVLGNIQSGDIGQRYNLYDQAGARQGVWDHNAMQFMGMDILEGEEINRLKSQQNYTETGLSASERQRLAELTGTTPQAGGNMGSVQYGDTTYTPEATNYNQNAAGTYQSLGR